MTSPEEYLNNADEKLDEEQRRWLQPAGAWHAVFHRVLATANRCLVRAAFRFEVQGREHVPDGDAGPLIFAPNHESSLDAMLLAAALDDRILRRTCFVARRGVVLRNPVVRLLNRVARTMPVDRDLSALAAGAALLRRGNHIVWFPEGTRSRQGELQEFKFGVGALARHFDASILPVRIDGAFEAMPPGSSLPRLFAPVAIRFGSPLESGQVAELAGRDEEAYRRVADEVRDRVEQLERPLADAAPH